MTDEQWARAARCEGWYDRDEAELLFSLVDGVWCEIGCWEGRSTTVLAETDRPGFAIDWFRGSPESPPGDTYAAFNRNLAGYKNVTVLPDRFENVHRSVPHLNLLHLDGEHSYAATKAAFDLYAPKVRLGGHVAFHDAEGGHYPEVEVFITELDPRWQRVASAGRLVVFKNNG